MALEWICVGCCFFAYDYHVDRLLHLCRLCGQMTLGVVYNDLISTDNRDLYGISKYALDGTCQSKAVLLE